MSRPLYYRYCCPAPVGTPLVVVGLLKSMLLMSAEFSRPETCETYPAPNQVTSVYHSITCLMEAVCCCTYCRNFNFLCQEGGPGHFLPTLRICGIPDARLRMISKMTSTPEDALLESLRASRIVIAAYTYRPAQTWRDVETRRQSSLPGTSGTSFLLAFLFKSLCIEELCRFRFSQDQQRASHVKLRLWVLA